MSDKRQYLAKIIHKHTGHQVGLNEGILGDIGGFFGNILNPGGIFTGIGAGIDEEAVKRAGSPAAWILFKAMAGPGTDEDAIEKVFSQYKDLRQIAQLSVEFDRLIAALVKEKSGIGTAIKKVGLGALRGSLLGVGVGFAGAKLAKPALIGQYDKFVKEFPKEIMGIKTEILKDPDVIQFGTNFAEMLNNADELLSTTMGKGIGKNTLIKMATKGQNLSQTQIDLLSSVINKNLGSKNIDPLKISDEDKLEIAMSIGIPKAMEQNPKIAEIFKAAGVNPVKTTDAILKGDTRAGMQNMAKNGALFGALFGGLDVAMNWMTNYLYDDDLATWLEDDGMDKYANIVRQARSMAGGRLMAGKTYIKNKELKNVIREEVIRAERKRRKNLKESRRKVRGKKTKGKTILTTRNAIKEAMKEQRGMGRLNESIMNKFSNFLRSVADIGGMVSGTNDIENVENMSTPDAWMIFKALVGPGTDEATVNEILAKRADDIPTLYAEFNRLIESLIAERSSVTGSIKKMGSMALAGTAIGAAMGAVSGVAITGQANQDRKKQQLVDNPGVVPTGNTVASMGQDVGRYTGSAAIGGALAGLGVTGMNQLWRWIQNSLQNQDLIWYLRGDGMEEQADMVEAAVTGGAVDRGVVPESFKRAKKKRLIRNILRQNGIRV